MATKLEKKPKSNEICMHKQQQTRKQNRKILCFDKMKFVWICARFILEIDKHFLLVHTFNPYK